MATPPVERIETWQIDRLIPYANNPRLHSPEQVHQLAASLREFGQTQLILIDEQGEMIVGHGRVLAAREIGMPTLKVGIAVGWTDEQKKAYRIADNQLGLTSTWDPGLLQTTVLELQEQNFDLQLLGFDHLELQELTEVEPAAQPDKQHMPAETRALFNQAWKQLAAEWLSLLKTYTARGYVSTTYTKRALAVLFLRARFFNEDIQRNATLAYTPHRVDVAGDDLTMPFVLQKCASEDGYAESLQFTCGDEPKFDKFLNGLALRSGRFPQEFPVLLARNIIDEFTPISVLDPCHGWGGRMLGFLLSKAQYYRGFDVDPETHAGVLAMFNDLKPYAGSPKAAKLTLQPFEESELDAGQFDLAFTSPPYFDVEKYNGDDSSWRRYKTFESWVAGFYQPLITKTAAALMDGGTFVLQVGNQRYPLERTAREIGAECGLNYIETRTTDMVNNYSQTEPEKGEVVLILRKGTARRSGDPAAKYGRVL